MRSANTFQARGWGLKHDSFTAVHVIETFDRLTPRSFNPAVAPRPCVFVPRHRPRRRGARPSIFSEINLEMSANHVPVSEGGFFFSPVSTSRSSVFGELGRPRWRPRGACSAALSGVRETSRKKRRDSKRRVAGGHNAPAWASEHFFVLGGEGGSTHSETMSEDDNDTGEDCPLCCNPFDATDKHFRPCKCGYQICAWCWHQRECPPRPPASSNPRLPAWIPLFFFLPKGPSPRRTRASFHPTVRLEISPFASPFSSQ